jgi:hypothetical protein
MIPEFRQDGALPAGRHWAEWEEFVQRFGQTPHRERLLAGLREAIHQLKVAGCRTVYVDGTFVTTKQQPGDFDACWDITGVDAEKVDAVFFEFANGRAAQKARFGGEFFPAQLPEGGTGLDWLEFFQQDRNGQHKGIVAVELESVP